MDATYLQPTKYKVRILPDMTLAISTILKKQTALELINPPVGVIPHNTYVKGNYLVTSYYANGVIINDMSDPHTIVEVGNYGSLGLA